MLSCPASFFKAGMTSGMLSTGKPEELKLNKIESVSRLDINIPAKEN
jgi:hypothetical protein